jgi:hypothetical protein
VIPEAQRGDAFDLLGRGEVTAGGVPYSRNPYRRGPAVPTAPGAPVAPPGPPPAVVPLDAVAGNSAEIERAKVVGKGTGEAQLALPQALARFTNQTAQTDLVISNIDKALQEASVWTAGPIGQAIGWVPGTPAFDFKNRIDTIKANVGFQQLQQMRYESPTGGALGQVAVQELAFLQSALGNLEQAQSPAQLTEMLGQVKTRYEQFKAAALADFDSAQKKAQQPLTPNAAAPQPVEARVTNDAPCSSALTAFAAGSRNGLARRSSGRCRSRCAPGAALGSCACR